MSDPSHIITAVSGHANLGLESEIGRAMQGATFSGGLPVATRATDPDAADQNHLGWLVYGGVAGMLVGIQKVGQCYVKVGAAGIAAGTKELTCDATGRAIACAAGDRILAVHDGQAASENDEILVYAQVGGIAIGIDT